MVMHDSVGTGSELFTQFELNRCDREEQTHSSLGGKAGPSWRTTAAMRCGPGAAPSSDVRAAQGRAKQEPFYWIMDF